MPKNTVDFTISLTVQQLKCENIVVIMEFPEGASKTKLDLGYIEEWTKSDPNADLEASFEVTLEKKVEGVRIDEVFALKLSKSTYALHFVNAEDGKVL